MQAPESAPVFLLRTVGEMVLRFVPAAADKRTVALLTEANYCTSEHLAVYTGIRTLLATFGLILALMSSTGGVFSLFFAIIFAVLLWIFPNYWLAKYVKTKNNKQS